MENVEWRILNEGCSSFQRFAPARINRLMPSLTFTSVAHLSIDITKRLKCPPAPAGP
jgi:hypothetical protein